MRTSRHQMFMEMAHAVAKRSTCPRLNVGAIIVSPKLEIFMGYNGAPPGEQHCTDVGCHMVKGSCKRAVHAEINALNRIEGYDPVLIMYVTNSPCEDCTRAIIKSMQIGVVLFENEYRSVDHLILLQHHGIKVLRLVPNGCIMNLQGDVVETKERP